MVYLVLIQLQREVGRLHRLIRKANCALIVLIIGVAIQYWSELLHEVEGGNAISGNWIIFDRDGVKVDAPGCMESTSKSLGS